VVDDDGRRMCGGNKYILLIGCVLSYFLSTPELRAYIDNT